MIISTTCIYCGVGCQLDLHVRDGELLTLLGPSGSGKTTLLNCLGGIDTPTSGEIIVEGKKISGCKERELSMYRRETVGWVFQFFNLIPSLTALENVELPMAEAGLALMSDCRQPG